nr:heavy metal translocating P-type ATPase [Vineibacter terrae]
MTQAPAGTAGEELLLASRTVGSGLREAELSVPDMHCGACMRRIETALGALAGVERARVNLSTRSVSVRWQARRRPPPLVETLQRIGFAAHLRDADSEAKDGTLAELVRSLAVAGFAASNIMLLSVSVWSGADPQTRDLFHAVSAVIALPALAYAGRVFFRSAWRSLRHGRTNMDVPISVGVLLAFGLSLYETLHHGPHAYFDAAVTLLFFLLVGRTLDHVMRERARQAVKGLARLAARGARVRRPDGTEAYLPVNDIATGMTVLLAAGERVPVDGRVDAGTSDIDAALVTGESRPQPVAAGGLVRAGTLNLTGPLAIVATAPARESFLAEMVSLMQAAEASRSVYRRIADRAASLYAPTVHLTALLTFAGWMIATGDAHRAITIAIAVLIITCPCALGLAVPMVQVVAAGRLFENGIMVKDGAALERLAEVDTVVFDKTGTLTLGQPRLVDRGAIDPASLALAAAIATHSRHPFARAIADAARQDHPSMAFDSVAEHAGLGLEARTGTAVYRLGRASWALAPDRGAIASDPAVIPSVARDLLRQDAQCAVRGRSLAALGMTAGAEWPAACDGPAPDRQPPDDDGVVLSCGGAHLATFQLEDRLRAAARATIEALARDGLRIAAVSGDAEAPVQRIAAELGIEAAARVLPREKVQQVAALTASGRKVLMVGDGLNDAPALAAAHASMAPATAADVGRSAADFVFLRESLGAVAQAIRVARDARRLVRQNFAFAVAYNVVAIPIAVLGQVTPLVAAVAMSASSLVVVANALRLPGRRKPMARDDAIGAAPALAALRAGR